MEFIKIDGARVKKLRKDHNLSQQQVAIACNMTKQAISSLEKKGSEAKIRDTNLIYLCQTLECDSLYLRGELDDPTTIFVNEERTLKKPFLHGGAYEEIYHIYGIMPPKEKLLAKDILSTIKDFNGNELTFILKLCKLYKDSK